MKGNMKNIKSKEDYHEQLPMARDKFTAVHFFSPSCGACKAVHSKVHQFAEMHPGLQFLMVNYNEKTEICMRLVQVLPLFPFYKGAEDRICSFSCTISTIHKFKYALERHGVQIVSLLAEKGWKESELKSFDNLLISQTQAMLHRTWMEMTAMLNRAMTNSIFCRLPSWWVCCMRQKPRNYGSEQ
ncbi:hypothetical protein BS78_01G467600 [Paspalum vaginatum]|nr:hypothetical protein BS78_01G467600 [Paspalum vaginatum]